MIINLFTTFISVSSNFDFLVVFRNCAAFFRKTTIRRVVVLLQTGKRSYCLRFHLQKFVLILGLGLLDCLHSYFTLAQRTCGVIFEPILDAIVMEVVFELAGQGQNLLFGLEFAETDTALIGEIR